MKSNRIRIQALLMLAATLALAGCERPPVETVQRGFRGLGMEQVYNPRTLATQAAVNTPPDAIPAVPEGGPPAKEVFKNVQVLGDLGAGEFTRTMLAITAWVSPKEGCNYCHAAGEDLSSDKLYTKVVARKMLQMTRQINSKWTSHVAQTGVTCHTCHRGQPVPNQVWFTDPGIKHAGGAAADNAKQNIAGTKVNLSSLPYDPLTPFLLNDTAIRVVSKTALPVDNQQNIKQTEWTYGLMTYISQSLGVNCTFCHNTRSFAEWEQSPPQRITAFHGITMTRELNNAHMVPLTATFPKGRLGPTGDVAKVGCATCHQGAYKPLYGAPMAKDHAAALGFGGAAPAAAAAAAPVTVPVAATATVATAAPAAATAAAVAALPARVLFASGKDTISAAAQQTLSAVAAALKTAPDAKVSLSGFADQRGNADKNMELAKQRAFAVRDALKAAGVAEARIVLKKPEFVIGGADGEARRVDIAAMP
jgi:photosynthetic reaction center cytochrome c subunit